MTTAPYQNDHARRERSQSFSVDGNGYVLTPNGTKIGQISGGILHIYDKRVRTSIAFTLDEHARLINDRGANAFATNQHSSDT